MNMYLPNKMKPKSKKEIELVKKAYCLGINDYDAKIWGDSDLRGCINDRDFWKSVLEENGFEVSILSDKITVKEFDELIKSFKGLKGQIVLTYSGHGTYYDRKTGKTSERMTGICLADDVYWDQQYREALSLLDENLNIVWISDSCFSEDNFKGVLSQEKSVISKLTVLPKSLEQRADKVATKAKKPPLNCSVIAFSAANKWQPGYDVVIDGKQMGAFTGCFKRIYQKNKTLSYFEFWQQTVKEVKKEGFKQNPQLQSICKKGCDPKLVIKNQFLK